MSSTTEQLLSEEGVFVPLASNYTKGIASFYDVHFIVTEGAVKIKEAYLQSLLDNYYEANKKDYRVVTAFQNNLFKTTLTESNGNEISSSSITLPFDKYVNNMGFVLSGNTLSAKLYNDSTVLKTVTGITLPTYADRLEVTTITDGLNFKLYSGNNVLTSQDVEIITQNNTVVSGANTIELSMSNTGYVLTAKLKDAYGTTISTDTIDLPLESSIVNIEPDDDGLLVLTLRDGTTSTVRLTDLFSGYVSEQTYNTKIAEIDTKLSNIYTKSEVDSKIASLGGSGGSGGTTVDAYTKGEIDIKLSNIYTKSQVDAMFGSYVSDIDVLLGEGL